jgi:hypothetical protein
MTIYSQTQFRMFLVSLVLAAAVIPIGSGARSQELLWATQAGGSGNDQGRGIATTARGDSYVTGLFAGTATFGQEPNQTSLTAVGGADIFVAKYAPDGTLLWATRAGGSSDDVGGGIATTARGDSYVTGLFEGTATFGQEPNQTVLTAAGGVDIFVAKYR